MSELFYIANLLEVGRKKTLFLNFMDFNSVQIKNEVKYSHNKC